MRLSARCGTAAASSFGERLSTRVVLALPVLERRWTIDRRAPATRMPPESGEFDFEYSYKPACFLGATGGEQALFDPVMSGILQSSLVSRARSHQCKRETRQLKSNQVPRRLAKDCLSRVIVNSDRVIYDLDADWHRTFSLARTGGFGHCYASCLLRSLKT